MEVRMKKKIKISGYISAIIIVMVAVWLWGYSCGRNNSKDVFNETTRVVGDDNYSTGVNIGDNNSEENTTYSNEESTNDSGIKEQESREQASKEQVSKEQASREEASKEQVSKEQASREQASKEQESREQASKEQESREQASKEQASREQASKEQASREQASKEAETKKPVTDDNGKTPYEAHGRLQVVGTKLVDKNGNPYQLKGASTHGMVWFPQYVSYDTFKYMRDSFGVNVVRLAMYTAEYNGYCEGGDKNYLKSLVKQGVQAATDLGLYVIIDWHILHDLTPHKYKADAIEFFREMSSTYKDYDNVIYEICNEPNGGTSWADIKAYANEVIPVIRANDKDAIIIVGTPNWSQDVDVASKDKITGYDNIMYSLHFYAATHKQWLRDKAQTAINNGCALFVSEFSICDASGNGGLDVQEANKWIDFLNKKGISFVGWNLSNKAESSAMFQSWCGKTSGFDDSELTEWAKWLKGVIQ